MKKLMIASALVAFCGAVMADGIESANIVGYNQVEINKQYTILGIPFTGTTGAAMSIQDALPYCAGMTKGNATSSSDNIQIMDDAGNYDVYFLCNGYKSKGVIAGGDGKWVKDTESAVSTTLMPAGTPFWYVAKNYATPYTITVAGEVLSTSTNETPLNVTYQLIANPYPCDLPLNDCIPYVDGMTKGNATSSADTIQIMDDAGNYDIYFLCNGYKSKGVIAGGDGKWVKDTESAVSTDVIPAGKGGWFVRKNSTTASIKIVNPTK